VLLDIYPEAGRQRRAAQDAAEDRLESEPDDFHARIRAAFLELAAADPDHYLVLDARADRDELAEAVAGRIAGLLP
jgi:dTMP kinase